MQPHIFTSRIVGAFYHDVIFCHTFINVIYYLYKYSIIYILPPPKNRITLYTICTVLDT